ncbi:Major facilitator superfamily domain general substrate transporter [Penicillium cosmopolitanum]|uniref:Major facilitator superfamily domain general substrate transporter n=1 Tax=Penicillium cosmopolitanum TaxID=1131564 RepID=A0A9W9SJ26_9EURO|nr:Major facilitator superfamily domain general substrate transporter [Penicillium cosmopolitanum]KAJ5379112.1 Major facilitator superfamily domain general substrate transporter [Penicillium cosmopolitanum]
MGSPEIIQRYFGNESKTTLDPNASVQSVDDVKHPAQESTLQLFENEEPTDAQQWQPGVRDWLVFICIVILAMMDAFDATVLIPMLPDLANTFDEPFVSVLWINTAYLVLNAASQLYFTMMSDVFSHGAVWTIAVLPQPSGIGGGGAMSLCFVVMTESTPEHIQSRYSCYILLTRIIGIMVGPVVGGLFIDYAHWTWAFYFNFIFCALGMLVIPFAVDLRVSKSIPLRKLRILDWSGATMAFMGLGGILVGLSWGGISYRWNEWQTLVPIAVGVAVLIALLFYESTWALHPQFGSRVLGNPGIAMTYAGCFCHGFVIFCQLQFFTVFFISTKYLSTSLSGIALLAISGLSIAPAAVVGVVLARESQCAKWIISGVGFLQFLLPDAQFCHGLLLSSYNIQIQSIPKEEGTALSTMPIIISNYMRTWGMAVAIPVGGVVFLSLFGRELHLAGLDRELINTAKGYIILMDQVKMPDEYREAIKDAAALALQGTWEVATGVAAVGGISSVVLWRRRCSA